jgi:hypothetical protein
VDKYRAGSGDLDEVVEGMGIRAPRQLHTAAHTPKNEDIKLTKKIGQGSSWVVHHIFGVHIEEPLEHYDLELWEKRVASIRRASHVTLEPQVSN